MRKLFNVAKKYLNYVGVFGASIWLLITPTVTNAIAITIGRIFPEMSIAVCGVVYLLILLTVGLIVAIAVIYMEWRAEVDSQREFEDNMNSIVDAIKNHSSRKEP